MSSTLTKKKDEEQRTLRSLVELGASRKLVASEDDSLSITVELPWLDSTRILKTTPESLRTAVALERLTNNEKKGFLCTFIQMLGILGYKIPIDMMWVRAEFDALFGTELVTEMRLDEVQTIAFLVSEGGNHLSAWRSPMGFFNGDHPQENHNEKGCLFKVTCYNDEVMRDLFPEIRVSHKAGRFIKWFSDYGTLWTGYR